MEKTTAEIASALARQAVKEPFDSVRIIVTGNGVISGMVKQLLEKAHNIPKKEIREIGYTMSDDLIDQVLRQTGHFIIIPKDIINNRRCIFTVPAPCKVFAISFLDGEIDSMPIACEEKTLEFKPGWFV